MAETLELSPEVKAALPSLRDSIYGNPQPNNAAPPVQNEPLANSGQPNGAAIPSGNEPPPGAPAVFNVAEFLKENFGVEDLSVAKSTWQELQALKNAPPQIKDLEFPDEIGKKIYENIKAGNTDEVQSYLRGQQVLRDLETKTPDEKLKLFIQLKNPRFDANDVNEEFNDTYHLDEENIAPEKLAREKKKLEQRKEDDVLQAQQFFSQYKSKIDLPDIAKPQVDQAYIQYQENLKRAAEQQPEVVASYQKFTPQDLALKFKFNDEANKFEFDSLFEPDSESLKAAADAVSNQDVYWKRYINEDGSPRRDVSIRDYYNAVNIERIVLEAQKQAVNAERKRMLTVAKTGGDGIQRNYNIDINQDQQLTDNRQKIYGRPAQN